MEILPVSSSNSTTVEDLAGAGNPVKEDSLNLPDHLDSYKDGDGDASFQLKSDSLPHAHTQATKTYYHHEGAVGFTNHQPWDASGWAYHHKGVGVSFATKGGVWLACVADKGVGSVVKPQRGVLFLEQPIYGCLVPPLWCVRVAAEQHVIPPDIFPLRHIFGGVTRNSTLVKAARTMLSASKLPLSFWAEAVATACYTQNRSIIISTHGKMAYHIINDRKPSIKHLHIFGCICYITKDGENLDKMKEKGDPCVMVGYSTQSKGYRVLTTKNTLNSYPSYQV
ncbi:retrovirus-related pol polyprotein from transposon TNT 1-94 [Tanacetum coccineum]